MRKKLKKVKIILFFVILFIIQIMSLSSYTTSTASEEKIRQNIQNEIVEERIFLSPEEREILELVNKYRKDNGLKELKPLFDLQKLAKLKADDLKKDYYFDHVSPVLGSPFEMLMENGVDYFSVEGENLAGIKTGKKAVTEWIKSEGHRENILEEKFEYTGIAVVDSERYGKICVQIFIGI